MYTEVHEFFEPVENGSRKLLYEFLQEKLGENSTDKVKIKKPASKCTKKYMT